MALNDDDDDARMDTLSMFAGLPFQLARLVALHASGTVSWVPLRDQDPSERNVLFRRIAAVLRAFGDNDGAAAADSTDTVAALITGADAAATDPKADTAATDLEVGADAVASLFASFQTYDTDTTTTVPGNLPLAALPWEVLDALCRRCWSLPGADGDDWLLRLRRLARATWTLGCVPPPLQCVGVQATADTPSSRLVWRQDRVATQEDVEAACRTLREGGHVPVLATGV